MGCSFCRRTTPTDLVRSIPMKIVDSFLVGSILWNGTERNDGLNHGTEHFLK